MDKHDELLRELKQANPVNENQFDEWVKEESSQFLQTRILTESRSWTDRWMRPRGVLIPVSAAIVVTLAIIALVFALDSSRPPSGTSAENQWGGGHSANQAVLREEALGRVAALSNTDRPPETSPMFAETDNGADDGLVGRAIAAGIILPAEGPDFRLKEPITRGEFALWIWRVCGSRLAPTQSAEFTDLGTRPEDERRAIITLARAAIVLGYADGSFQPTSLLSPEEEHLILSRIAEAIQPQDIPQD